MSEIIDLGDRNLAVENLGDMWQDFAARLMPEAAILFKDAYNLISISLPENGNDIQITNILIDETLETSDTVMHIRKLLIDSIVDCLQMMGIIIDYDYVSPDSLKDLVHILDTIYTLDGLDDLMQLVEILDDELIDAALGLTIMEAERAFARAYIEDGELTASQIPIIIKEKESIIKKSGFEKSEMLAIGDEIRDIVAANKVEIPFGAVSWGFSSIEALQQHSPSHTFTEMHQILEAVEA